ncbi:MAG: protein kinase [Myxococcales bacterium]
MSERKDLPAGTRLGDGDRYEIRRKVGQGAMAEVYQAVDRRLNNRIVAVKTLSASLADHKFTDKMLALFIEEAQALSRVRDDNVVAVLDSGTDAGGTPYMVMEFLNGRDLSGLLREEKQLSVERTADIMLAVCAGVHACHIAGIIHRDIKPANIFLERTAKGEQPKVLDFSVAKIPVSRDQTRTDLIVGTQNYMSPEQALGRPADELSDQYSIGALIYRCLVGKPPQGLLARPREIRPEIPQELETILLRTMDPIPANRYPSVHHLGHDLLAFASIVGRLRWNSYYASPPAAVPVTIDRPSGASAGIEADIDATTKGEPYDFGIHERTTRAETPPRGVDTSSPERTPSSDDDGPPTLNAKPTIDARRPPTPSSPDDISISEAASPALSSRSTAANESSSSKAVSARSRRHRVVTASIVGSVAVLVAAFGTARLVGAGRRAPTVPLPPAWTRTEEPAAVEHPPVEAQGPTVVHAVPVVPPPSAAALANSGPSLPATAASNDRRSASLRRPNRPQRNRGGGLVDGNLRWLGGTVSPPSGADHGGQTKYPAVGATSDSKYPAVQ